MTQVSIFVNPHFYYEDYSIFLIKTIEMPYLNGVLYRAGVTGQFGAGQNGACMVKRIYVEKKADFAVKARELKEEIESYLGIKTI